MNVDRLERLAKLLDQQTDACPVKFDLSGWGEAKKVEENICGTQACAVGLACLSGEFDSDGLFFERGTFQNPSEIYPIFNGQSSWGAVNSFFGLTHAQSMHLFDMCSYDNTRGASAAHEVAGRIRTMIHEHKGE